MSPLPVDLLQRDWQRELHGPTLQARFLAWRGIEPALARFEGPAGVLRPLRRPASSAEKDAVLCALLRRARTEPLAGRIVLQAILPGLMALAGRMLVDTREREELWSVLMLCAWEQIRAYPIERRPRKVAANLLLDCLRATLKTLSDAREDPACGAEELPRGELRSASVCAVDVEGTVKRAVAARMVSKEESELILATRIDGVSLEDLACSQGVSFDTLKHRRARAERRLLFFLGHRFVPQRGPKRPFSVARVSGDGPATGFAGARKASETPRR